MMRHNILMFSDVAVTMAARCCSCAANRSRPETYRWLQHRRLSSAPCWPLSPTAAKCRLLAGGPAASGRVKSTTATATDQNVDASNGKMIVIESVKAVKQKEMKQFLSDNNIAFTEGYACLVTSCPRHVRRKMRLNELDKLFINMKTGRSERK